jgi:hypothetical protein
MRDSIALGSCRRPAIERSVGRTVQHPSVSIPDREVVAAGSGKEPGGLGGKRDFAQRRRRRGGRSSSAPLGTFVGRLRTMRPGTTVGRMIQGLRSFRLGVAPAVRATKTTIGGRTIRRRPTIGRTSGTRSVRLGVAPALRATKTTIGGRTIRRGVAPAARDTQTTIRRWTVWRGPVPASLAKACGRCKIRGGVVPIFR